MALAHAVSDKTVAAYGAPTCSSAAATDGGMGRILRPRPPQSFRSTDRSLITRRGDMGRHAYGFVTIWRAHMFPIREATLSFGEISDYWSREIQPPASPDELLDILVGAWWLAEIRSSTGATRLELLKRMFERMYGNGDAPIFFIVGQSIPPPFQELPDGALLVDLRSRVSVPSSNIGIWDEDNCSDAFRALAQTCSSYPDHKPGFLLN